MGNRRRLARLLRTKLRSAGRQYETARREYAAGKSDDFGLPTDGDGRARIVCRRYAEKRTVAVDEAGRPACYEADHPDCEGCAADVRDGVVGPACYEADHPDCEGCAADVRDGVVETWEE